MSGHPAARSLCWRRASTIVCWTSRQRRGLGTAVFSYVLFKSNYVPRALAAWGVFANLVLATFTLAIIIFGSGTGSVTPVTVGDLGC
jgi:hypothetical protein